MVKAIWNNAVIAESDDTIVIEGNQYFPPDAVRHEYLKASEHHTFCGWKGECSYFDVVVDGQENANAAWYYPVPIEGSVAKVGRDYSNYIAFWHGVTVEPS